MPVNPTSAAKMPITTSAAIADITGNQARLRSDRNTDHEILPSSHEFLIRCMRRSIARAVGRLGPPRVSCRRRSAHALHLVEQCVLPALVLVRGDVTLVAQLGELLDLGRQARSTTAAGLVTQRLGHGLADRAGACARVGRPAGLHLPVDLLLHAVGMADVGELRRPPSSPADCTSRVPAPMIRSQMPWWKLMLLIRSSGISTPCRERSPVRQITRSLVTKK